VLYELRVENLLLMERAELQLGPGLNILTGETGAGKTLLAHALDLLLGGRPRSGIVRDGAGEAYVEGVFAAPQALPESVKERVPDDVDELVLSRRVWRDGRTRAYICGRSATLAELRELGARLLAFYGQHEHRKLMLASAQLDVLDGYCGGEQLELRARVAQEFARFRALERRVEELRAAAGGRDRELDLVRFELEEIESAAPSADEQQELLAERERLRNFEALQSAAVTALRALAPDQDGGAVELLAGAAKALESVVALDKPLAELSARLDEVRYEADELSREVRSQVVEMEFDPGRLEEVEERLALIARLERKHGGSIEEVLKHAEQCRTRLHDLEHAEVALEDGERELGAARAELERLAARLRRKRENAAPKLARVVRERLAELAMPDARFEVEIQSRADGLGPTGADVVEFAIAPNAGLAAGPLREIASGGELSRVMLALLSVAQASARGGGQPLLVFDEIDAGVGGQTARAVGEHLRSLASGRQVLCITHLPQVAALGESHFTIVKHSDSTPAHTTVSALQDEQVVGELVRMLGAGEGDSAASEHARTLLAAA
jgi:DNA repair protein RecN (Recombination protein N)